METIQQTDLVTLKVAKQNERLETLKPRLTQYPKYFYNLRENSLLVYDNTSLYIIGRDDMKNFNLGKQLVITDIAYNSQRQILVFLTVQGLLHAHFLNTKTQFILKKDVKKNAIFDWVFNAGNIFQFFIADQTGVKLYKVQEQKKTFKQVKHLSGKYNSYLYEPNTEVLVGFPMGDCNQIHPFVFNQSRYSNWYKLNPISINFANDQALTEAVRTQKSLGLDWSRNNKQIFVKSSNETHFTNLIKINKRCFLIFFFAEQGLLKIFPISEQKEKQIIIKLPSDSIPDFLVIDNMLTVHLRVEGITFIYDLNGYNLQPLVSPYPLRHKDEAKIKNCYQYVFVGQRAIHPSGLISKWEVQLGVIFNYLKNQLQIFDFFLKRGGAKMELLKWIRKDLFKIKQLSLSKFWKSLFMKYLSNVYPQTEVINLIDLFSNVFYTVSQEQMLPKERLMNIILECLRQALELKMNIPIELQNLAFDLLMEFKKYEFIVYLSHNDIIKDSAQIIDKITKEYLKNDDMMLGTLAVDMTFRSGSHKDMVKILMKFQRVRDAKKFIKQNYDKMDVLYLIEVAKYIKNGIIVEEYLKYIKSFILLKFPTMSIAFLKQAEEKILVSISKKQQIQIEKLKQEPGAFDINLNNDSKNHSSI